MLNVSEIRSARILHTFANIFFMISNAELACIVPAYTDIIFFFYILFFGMTGMRIAYIIFIIFMCFSLDKILAD